MAPIPFILLTDQISTGAPGNQSLKINCLLVVALQPTDKTYPQKGVVKFFFSIIIIHSYQPYHSYTSQGLFTFPRVLGVLMKNNSVSIIASANDKNLC